MAALLLLATFIGLVSDSGTYFNRLYTTAVMWHLPLIAIAMLAYGIVCDKRQGCSSTLAYCGIAMLVVAFFMSNIMKNVVADAADNAQNIVKIGTNTAKSDAISTSTFSPQRLRYTMQDAPSEHPVFAYMPSPASPPNKRCKSVLHRSIRRFEKS